MTDWLWLSLRAAGCSTLLCIALGTVLAWLLAKRTFFGRSALEALTVVPLVLPPTVLGYFLLVSFGAQSRLGGWYRAITGSDLVFSFNGIVAAAFVGSLPLFVRQAQLGFAGVAKELEDAARSTGASEWQLFRHITAPLARPALAAGAVLAFARSLGDFGATLMVGGNIPGETSTLALAVYDTWQAGEAQTAAGLAGLLAGIALVVAVAAGRLAPVRSA